MQLLTAAKNIAKLNNPGCLDVIFDQIRYVSFESVITASPSSSEESAAASRSSGSSLSWQLR